MQDSLDWIKSRADPGEIAEDLQKKFKEMEKIIETSYSILEKRVTQSQNDFTAIKTSFNRAEDTATS